MLLHWILYTYKFLQVFFNSFNHFLPFSASGKSVACALWLWMIPCLIKELKKLETLTTLSPKGKREDSLASPYTIGRKGKKKKEKSKLKQIG